MRHTPRSPSRVTRSTALAVALAATLGAALATPSRAAGAQTPATVASKTPARTAAKAPARARRITLGDVAGRWAMRVMLRSGDSTLVTHELIATPDRAGWRLVFRDRDPIPARAVAVAGDSIVAVFGPYESVLRDGVMVTTRSVYRLRGDRLYATAVAQYATYAPDSLLQVRSVGTRVP